MKWVVVIAAAAFVMTPAPAFAQESSPLVDEVPELRLDFPDGEIVPLDVGTRAPFAGMLIRDSDLTEWRLLLERAQFRLRIFELRAAEVLELRIEQERVRTRSAESRLELREELWRQRVAEISEQLASARADSVRQWWEHPALWFSIGVVVTAVGLGVVAAVVQ